MVVDVAGPAGDVMAGPRLRRPRVGWGERLLMAMIAFNVGGAVGTFLMAPGARSEAVGFLALAVSFTVWLDLRWRA